MFDLFQHKHCETTQHKLLSCPLNNINALAVVRNELNIDTNKYNTLKSKTDFLLFGEKNLPNEINSEVLKVVVNFVSR